jgi:hypothetical protein
MWYSACLNLFSVAGAGYPLKANRLFSFLGSGIFSFLAVIGRQFLFAVGFVVTGLSDLSF